MPRERCAPRRQFWDGFLFFPLEDVGGIPFKCYTAELSCGCFCML